MQNQDCWTLNKRFPASDLIISPVNFLLLSLYICPTLLFDWTDFFLPFFPIQFFSPCYFLNMKMNNLLARQNSWKNICFLTTRCSSETVFIVYWPPHWFTSSFVSTANRICLTHYPTGDSVERIHYSMNSNTRICL